MWASVVKGEGAGGSPTSAGEVVKESPAARRGFG